MAPAHAEHTAAAGLAVICPGHGHIEAFIRDLRIFLLIQEIALALFDESIPVRRVEFGEFPVVLSAQTLDEFVLVDGATVDLIRETASGLIEGSR